MTDRGGDRGANWVAGEVIGDRHLAGYRTGTAEPSGVALSDPRDRDYRGCSPTGGTDRRTGTRDDCDDGGRTGRVVRGCGVVGEVVGDGDGTGDGVAAYSARAVALVESHACGTRRAPSSRRDYQREHDGQAERDHHPARDDAEPAAETGNTVCHQEHLSVMTSDGQTWNRAAQACNALSELRRRRHGLGYSDMAPARVPAVPAASWARCSKSSSTPHPLPFGA